ncbi:MoaA/NifB/PqqE/SkfB family radical SAM enzyme [Elusimicrobium posterum]|uniref:radical SAM/SPASM domain-containing protein n=1 Tax=Elusimicrobium posterum TaxID=3116653 RepID=UPI003C71CAA3
MQQSKTGIAKVLVYIKIAVHVVWKYKRHLSVKFLTRAARLLHAFYDNKLIKLNDTYKVHIYIPAYPTPAFFKAIENKLFAVPPKSVSMVLSITKACTYKCPHCYQRFDCGADLKEDKLLQTVKAVTDSGVCFLNIEGGDAFLRFNELCAVMDNLDSNTEVWVNSTGANVSEEKLKILKQKGVCGLMISVHGPDADSHDKFVGVPGAFELAKETLGLCAKTGLGSAINAVLTYEDIQNNTLDKIMLLAKDLDCGFVQLIHPKRAGKWLENETLNDRDNEIRKYVEKAHAYYNSLPGYPALPAQAQEEHEDKFGCTCGGVDRFYIGASGEVQPCEFLNISFGNVNDEDFGIIFKRMRDCFKTPCTEWMCEVKAQEIFEFMKNNSITKTPVPYQFTKELVKNWKPGSPTKLYRKLGIYNYEK